MAPRERLEGRIHAVHRPPHRGPVFHGIGVCPFPGTFPLLAERQRRFAHLGGGCFFRIELDDAHHEIVHIGMEMRDDGTGIRAHPAKNEARQGPQPVNVEDAVGDLRIEAMLLSADPHVIVVLACAA